MSRSLQTVVIKLAYSPTCFVQLLAAKYFSHLASKKNFLNVSTTLLVSVRKSGRAYMIIGLRNSHSMTFKYKRLASPRKTL